MAGVGVPDVELLVTVREEDTTVLEAVLETAVLDTTLEGTLEAELETTLDEAVLETVLEMTVDVAELTTLEDDTTVDDAVEETTEEDGTVPLLHVAPPEKGWQVPVKSLARLKLSEIADVPEPAVTLNRAL